MMLPEKDKKKTLNVNSTFIPRYPSITERVSILHTAFQQDTSQNHQFWSIRFVTHHKIMFIIVSREFSNDGNGKVRCETNRTDAKIN